MTDASTPRSPDAVPDLLVEKLALGELSATEARDVRERLGDAAEDRLAALAESDQALLEEQPPARVAAEVERRLARLERDEERSRSPGWLVWAPVAAAAGIALVWWVNGSTPKSDPSGDQPDVIAEVTPPVVPDKLPVADDGPEQILLKGDPVLMIDRIENGRPQRMIADASVAAGDLLQVTYNAKGAEQGVVVSIDGAGVATLHYPEAETGSPQLDHGGPRPLTESYELDDAPGFERFFFVTVDVRDPKLDVARVMDAARTLASGDAARDGSLALPEGWRQQSTLLVK